MNRHFSKEDVQMANKHMKRCSTSLTVGRVQNKTTIRYHFIPFKTIILNEQAETSKCWWGYGENKFCVLLCQEWDLWRDCVPASPACFDGELLSFTQCVGVAWLGFSFFFRGNYSICTADPGCPWEEMSLGSPVSPSWTRTQAFIFMPWSWLVQPGNYFWFPLHLSCIMPNTTSVNK